MSYPTRLNIAWEEEKAVASGNVVRTGHVSGQVKGVGAASQANFELQEPLRNLGMIAEGSKESASLS